MISEFPKGPCVYCYTELSTGKRYVGQTINMRRRHEQHTRGYRTQWPTKFDKALHEGGAGAFSLAILALCGDDHKLCKIEEFFIAAFDCIGNGFNKFKKANFTNTAEFREAQHASIRQAWACPERRAAASAREKGRRRTPESRAKGSAAQRNLFSDPEFKARHVEWMSRVLRTPEVNAKRTASQRKRFEDPEELVRQSERAKLSSSTPEARARKSAAQKLRLSDPEERARHNERVRLSSHTPEARARNSASQKRRFSNPEERLRQSESLKHALSTPEARERKSEAMKKVWAARRAAAT